MAITPYTIVANSYVGPVITTGEVTLTGNTILTTFTIAHGLGKVPTHATVTPKNALGSGLRSVTWDSTNISINYVTAPTAGSISVGWMAVG